MLRMCWTENTSVGWSEGVSERWDVPSEKLKKIASLESSPMLRACSSCPHRHPKGELCAWPYDDRWGRITAKTCACTK